MLYKNRSNTHGDENTTILIPTRLIERDFFSPSKNYQSADNTQSQTREEHQLASQNQESENTVLRNQNDNAFRNIGGRTTTVRPNNSPVSSQSSMDSTMWNQNRQQQYDSKRTMNTYGTTKENFQLTSTDRYNGENVQTLTVSDQYNLSNQKYQTSADINSQKRPFADPMKPLNHVPDPNPVLSPVDKIHIDIEYPTENYNIECKILIN